MTPPGQLKRVLMTTDTVGGVWHYALELCRAFQAENLEVILATMGPLPRPEQRAEALALSHVTLCESEFRLEWMNEPWADVERAGQWLLELEWRHAPDLVHLNGFVHAVLPWRAPRLVVAHSCVLSWWEAVRGGHAPADWDRYRAAVSRGLHAADLVVAPTAAMIGALRRHYGQTARCAAIHNGRDAAEFRRATRKEPFILSVGRLWDDAKNTAALAAVAPELEWPVQVVGDTRGPDGVDRVPCRVQALGHCSPAALAEIYARAAIYALPARYEPFGLSVLEAALSGCALVLGDIPSLRELWDGAADFVPPGEPPALRAALARLMADPPLRQRRAAAARLRAGRYSTRRMARRYLETYRTLLAAAVRSAAATPASA